MKLLGCVSTTFVLGHTGSDLQVLEDGIFQKMFPDIFMLKSASHVVISGCPTFKILPQVVTNQFEPILKCLGLEMAILELLRSKLRQMEFF